MKKTHFFASLALLFSVSLFSQPSGYVGLWPFNGDVKDYSENNLGGTTLGDVTYVPGKFGQAIGLTGNSYVNMGNISSLNIANSEFSISVWIKTTNDTARQCIINKFYSATGYYSVGGYMLETGFTDGNIRFQLGVSAPNMVSIETPANYYNDNWHHVAVTRTADSVKMFFDGALVGSSSCSGMTFPNTNAPFSVGYLTQKQGHFFIGSVDDLKIYNQILNESEITALYNDDGTKLWKQNNNNIYYNEGNVGIGTTNPGSALDIVTRSPGNNAGITLNSLDGTGQKYLIASNSNNNDDGQGFMIKDMKTNIARFKINSNGFVGIGTNDPTSPLDIETKSPANNASIELNTLDGNGQRYVIASTSNNNNNGQGFVIKDITNNTTRLKINSNGNVGIGTLDPAEKLEVDGNIFIKDNNALILSSPNGTKFKITVDDNGNLTTSKITSLQSVPSDYDINIFPNPTDNQITVEIKQQGIIAADVEIYTLAGKMIYMKSYGSNTFKINTSDLSQGAYLLKLKDSNGNLIKADKFIKQ